VRSAEPAIGKLFDGISEAVDVLKGSVGAFWRKLGGVSSYDGLFELVNRTYCALERCAPAPISLDEIDEIACLVDRFARKEFEI
jgi:hypothetical protein